MSSTANDSNSNSNSNSNSDSSTPTGLGLAMVDSLILSHPNFPKPGIQFYDIFPVFLNPTAAGILMEETIKIAKEKFPTATKIAGLDARGFLFGPILAQRMGIPFIPIRKAGKLPGRVKKLSYGTEYSKDEIEIQIDSINGSNDKILLVDDLLATGGTLKAASDLIRECGASVSGCLILIELIDLPGRKFVGEHIETIFRR